MGGLPSKTCPVSENVEWERGLGGHRPLIYKEDEKQYRASDEWTKDVRRVPREANATPGHGNEYEGRARDNQSIAPET